LVSSTFSRPTPVMILSMMLHLWQYHIKTVTHKISFTNVSNIAVQQFGKSDNW